MYQLELANFLDSFANQDFINSYHVYLFSSKNYPVLFSSLLKKTFKSNAIKTIDLSSIDFEALQAELRISFLGQSSYYWLVNSHDLDVRRLKNIQTFLASYTGPHKLFVFFSVPIKNSCTVELPSVVPAGLLKSLFSTLYPQVKRKNLSFFDHITRRYQQIPLESACMIMEYSLVIGRQFDSFIEQWLDQIIKPEHSLFTLSSLFFAKNNSDFFRLWHLIYENYSPPFWTTFWSEQLWRAHAYIHYAKNKMFVPAKKISYRLPFSFMQKDWKKISSEELAGAHDFLYSLDWNAKNGLHPDFNLFFLKFFLGEFR